jgi:hypothetical protein
MSKSLTPNSLMDDPPQSTKCTRTVHLSLQGKSGVGKSLIASFIAQFYKDHGVRGICVDTDPVNQTFSQYAALGAQHLQLMDGNRPSAGEFEMAYQARVAIDRIQFAIKATEMCRVQSEPLKDAELQLLDALDRLEATERRFQERWRSPNHSKPRDLDLGAARAANGTARAPF